MNISSFASQVASTVTAAASTAVNMAAYHLDIHKVDRTAFEEAGNSPVKNDHLVVHAFQDEKGTMRAITAPNNFFGRTLQFIFGANNQIVTAVAKDIQSYASEALAKSAACTKASEAYSTLSKTPMITAEAVRKSYANISHDISLQDSSDNASLDDFVFVKNPLNKTEPAENSNLKGASNEQTGLLSHDVITEQIGLLSHDETSTSTDALLLPPEVILPQTDPSLEKTEEVNSPISSHPTAATHLETALKEVREAISLQKTNQPTTLLNSFSELLESFALNLE